MVRHVIIFFASVLTPAAVAAQQGAAPVILLGKPYPQYQQVASAFAEEWKKSTGKEPTAIAFPIDEAQQRQIHPGRSGIVVALGEAPAAWAIRQPTEFTLAFTMVVGPDRLKPMREQSSMKSRQMIGVSIEVPVADQLGVLRQLIPNVRRIGILTQDPAVRAEVAALRRACEERTLQLVHTELASSEDLPNKLDQLLWQVDLLWSVADSNVMQPQFARHIIGQCASRGIPLVGLSATFVKAGAALSFERDYREIGQMLARRCLHDVASTEASEDWWVESPPRMILSVNQRVFDQSEPPRIEGYQVQVAKY